MPTRLYAWPVAVPVQVMRRQFRPRLTGVRSRVASIPPGRATAVRSTPQIVTCACQRRARAATFRSEPSQARTVVQTLNGFPGSSGPHSIDAGRGFTRYVQPSAKRHTSKSHPDRAYSPPCSTRAFSDSRADSVTVQAWVLRHRAVPYGRRSERGQGGGPRSAAAGRLRRAPSRDSADFGGKSRLARPVVAVCVQQWVVSTSVRALSIPE